MNQRLVLGIDEAGRGPGLGPMVLAAVALDEPSATLLADAGVRDSKAFGSGASARRARAKLAASIRRHATWTAVEICEVAVIDAYVARGGLNQLERERARRLILGAPPCALIIADGRALFSPLAKEFAQLEARDRAEAAHLAVAAASVCAKALRDELFEEITARYLGEYGVLAGGGYVNAATCAFVAEYVKRHGRLPPEARKSWPWRGISVPAAPKQSTSSQGNPRRVLPFGDFGPAPPPPPPGRCAPGLAKPSRALAETRGHEREARVGVAGRRAGPEAPTESAGIARLRQRDD